MATKKLSLLLVALLTCASQPALTQGGGAGSGGASSGAASPGTGRAGGQVGAPSTTSGQKSVPPAASTNDRGTEASKNAPSAAAPGVSPDRGVGTAPNGRPIGSVGSGPGSPEQPHDVPVRP
jgi:hypothetical protein